jgi:hypothetical protein
MGESLMKILRSVLVFFLIVGLSLNGSTFANASAGPTGEPCTTLNSVEIYGNLKYKCIKAPRSISNPLGKKLVWSKGVALPKPKSLESSRNLTDRLKALNSLGLGKWKQTDNQGFNAQVFISTWPCIIYMAGDLSSAGEIFNNKVNLNSYSGFWVGIESQGWVVNQPYYDDKTCVRYFARKYGGRIFNVGTQSFEG